MSTLDNITEYFKKKHKILLMLDYDGTLTPIVNKPELAVLDKKTRLLLNKLANNNLIKVVIISGRSVSDLLKVSGIKNKNILIFGLHGGEKLKNGKIIVDIPNSYKEAIKKLHSAISDLTILPGIIIEIKNIRFHCTTGWLMIKQLIILLKDSNRKLSH